MESHKNPEIILVTQNNSIELEGCAPDYCGPDQCGPDYDSCKPND